MRRRKLEESRKVSEVEDDMPWEDMESWDEKKFSLQAQTLSIMFYSISGIRLEDDGLVVCKNPSFQ